MIRLQAIEERCNEVIRSGAAVRQVVVSDSNRQAVAASKLLRGVLPPPDCVNGPVRMIEIKGVDINACGGYSPSPHHILHPHVCTPLVVDLGWAQLCSNRADPYGFCKCSKLVPWPCRTHLHSTAEIQVCSKILP